MEAQQRREDWDFARFVIDRADEENDPKLAVIVDECFDAIDVSPVFRPRTRFLRGEVTDAGKLREIATRWVSHPDYPGTWFGG